MQRLALTIVLVAATATSPSAAAQPELQPSDLPDIPILQPSDLPDIPILQPSDLPDIPVKKKTRSAVFNVSLYGVQRWTRESETQRGDDAACGDEYGTYTSRSVVRFSTKRPRRARVVRLRYPPGAGHIHWLGGGRSKAGLPVTATFAHSGSVDAQFRWCGFDGNRWHPKPPPPEENCTATLEHGFDLRLAEGRIEATSFENLVDPGATPFLGCPWGDLSTDLYDAKAPLKVRRVLDEDRTQVVLRMRDEHVSDAGKSSTVTRRHTTIYVTFKKVGK